MASDRVIVYVGDVGEYLANIAKHRHRDARLINSSNYKKLASGTYYTSIGDLEGLYQFGSILTQAQEIVYAPPKIWSDATGMLKSWTEHYLQIACTDNQKKVIGFDVPVSDLMDHCRQPVSQRAAAGKQIWIAGCSISHGIGVEPHQCYGNIIAQNFDLPVTFLTHPGSSISWAADQILRSDIRDGDLIFWGITGISRVSHWDHVVHEVRHGGIATYEKQKNLQSIIKKNYYASEHLQWQCVLATKQVDNYCRKIKAKLMMATLLVGMEVYLKDHSNFLPLAGLNGCKPHDWLLDLGTDHEHPGPKSHIFYAESMTKRHKDLYGAEN